MASTDLIKAVVWENMGASLMARVEDNDGTDITQAAIASIARKVFDNRDTDGDAISTSAPAVDATIHDTLQTGGGWSKDEEGYNFRDDVDDDVFIVAGREYRVEYVLSPTSGADLFVGFLCTCMATRS